MDMEVDENTVGKLEEEALKRRERLKNLKSIYDHRNDQNVTNQDRSRLPKPMFRSYTPSDEALKENKLEAGKPGNVEELIKDQLEAAKPELIGDDIDLSNLAPRKIDWDLKRNIAKKLNKLEKRTQKAIVEIIRTGGNKT